MQWVCLRRIAQFAEVPPAEGGRQTPGSRLQLLSGNTRSFASATGQSRVTRLRQN